MFTEAFERVRDWYYTCNTKSFPIRSCLRVVLIVCLLAGWYTLTLDLRPHGSSPYSATPPILHVSKTGPAYSMAAKLEDGCWHLVHCDAIPSVSIGSIDGYRVILEHEWSYVDRGEFPSTPTVRRLYKQFVFVPTGQSGAAKLGDRIPWRDFGQDAPQWLAVEGPAERVYMGIADGFHVYGYMTIAQQEEARRQLGTVGGEDPLGLLKKRLARCKSDAGYLRTIRLIGAYGDAAVPIFEREIARDQTDRRFGIIMALVKIPGPESAKLILSLHKQDDLRNAVATALNDVPFRRDVIRIYLDYVSDEDICRFLQKVNGKEMLTEKDTTGEQRPVPIAGDESPSAQSQRKRIISIRSHRSRTRP